MNIGEAMKKIREERNVSRVELAKGLGVTPSALSKIEREKVCPKNTTIERFCKVFHLPLAYVYQQSFTIEDYEWPLELDFEIRDTGKDPL